MPLTLAVAQQWLPFPHVPVYYQLNDEMTDTVLDVYLNHHDVHSAKIFPGLYQYWQDEMRNITMRIHIQPLADLPYSFMAGAVSTYIQSKQPAEYLSFVSYMLTNQDKYLVKDTMSYDKAAEYLSEDAEKATNGKVTAEEISNALADHEFLASARIPWKQANAARITQVPTYFLNGVEVYKPELLVTYHDWESFFETFWGLQKVHLN